MTQYLLSQNPTVANFAVANNGSQTFDTFIVDTGASSAELSIRQVGGSLVVSDGTNTAVLGNVLLAQITTQQFQNADGSIILIGDNTTGIQADNGGQNYALDAQNQPPGTILTTAGDDFIQALGGNDTVNGIAGNDRIYLNDGADFVLFALNGQASATIYGGQGSDTVVSAISNVEIVAFGNIGDDTIQISLTDADATVYGGQGNDRIDLALAGSNVLSGDLGNDLISNIFSGDSTLLGGAGSDTITSSFSNDLIFGNADDDFINAGIGVSTVYGGQGRDTIRITSAPDTDSGPVFGNLGSDTIYGGEGRDSLYGGQGNDLINGGLGPDTLSGDLGNDVIALATGTFTGNTDATVDVILGFTTGADKIATAALGRGTTANYTEFADASVDSVEDAITAANANYAKVGGRAFTFVAGESDGYLVFDNNNGDGIADTALVLRGANSTTEFDLSDIIAESQIDGVLGTGS